MELQLREDQFIGLDEITDEEKSAVGLGLDVQQTGTLGCNWKLFACQTLTRFL